MSPRTRDCDTAHARKRLDVAERYLADAEILREFDDGTSPYQPNSLINIYVHAGIAASDAICCLWLKEHSVGESHADAVALIRKVRPDGSELGKALGSLLSVKTEAGYGAKPLAKTKAVKAQRDAERLVRAARDRMAA